MTTGASQPIARNEIIIDDFRYRLNGDVRQYLVNLRPGKVTIGDYTDASNPMASEFSLGDFRDGIGVNRGDIRTDTNSVWYATGQLRYPNSYILQRLATATAAGPAFEVQTLTIYKDALYGTFGTVTHSYNAQTDSWGSNLRTLAAAATDTAVGILYPSGTATETLVIANGTDVDYYDNSAWAENTGQGIKYLVFWGDLLWGITDAGQMYYTDDLSGSWVIDALLPLPSGSVTGLLVARGPDRESHVYAVTKRGLWVHDDANARFLPTDLVLPEHRDGGKGSEVWRGRIYSSAGNAIYAFQAGSDQTIVGVVGPDLRDGMPSGKRGPINTLIGSHNELLAFTNSADTAIGTGTVGTRISRGFGNHHGVTFGSDSGTSTILGWNERGWEVKWESSANAREITAGVVGTVGTTYRLWWAANQRVYYMDLPVDVVNPLQIASSTYESEAVLESTWFDMGIRNQQKLALAAIVDTINPSTDETVKIEYATNLVETYTTIATKDSTGEVEYRLPSRADGTGVPFRWWKWRITLSRGDTNTSTPEMVRITLVWRPRAETLYGITASLDLTQPVAGVPVVQQFKNLRDSFNSGRLLSVSFRADQTGNQTYLMDPVNIGSSEEGGQTAYGSVQVELAEPISTHDDLLHDRD